MSTAIRAAPPACFDGAKQAGSPTLPRSRLPLPRQALASLRHPEPDKVAVVIPQLRQHGSNICGLIGRAVSARSRQLARPAAKRYPGTWASDDGSAEETWRRILGARALIDKGEAGFGEFR